MANIIDILITAKDQASGVMGAVGRAASGMSGYMEKSQAASKEAAVGLAAVGAAGAAFVGFGAKVAGDLEASRQGFITLLGSAKKADEIIALVKRDAAATPFELPGLIQANQLLTSVTKDGVRSEAMLMNVGKALSAMGKGQPELDRIIVNLQQIGAVGHASAMDIKQFAFAGIPIYEMLAEATGKSGEAIQDMVSNGEVSFDMLEDMFAKAGNAGGRFANAFTSQAGTFNQLWSNVADTVSIAAAEIVEQSGIFDILKQAMAGFIDFIGSNQDAIVEGISGAFTWLKDNGALVAGIITGLLAPAIIGMIGHAVVLAATLAPWVALFAGIALVLDVVAKKMGGWDKLLGAVGNAFNQVVMGVSAFVAAFKEGDVTSDGFVGVMERVGVALRQAWAVIKPVAAFVGKVFVAAFKDLWTVISTQLVPAVMRFMPVFKAIGIIIGGVLVVALAAAIAAIYVIIKAVTIFFSVLAGLYNFIADFASGTVSFFAAVVGGIVTAFNGIVLAVTTVLNFIKALIAGFVAGAMLVWNGILFAAQAAWNGIVAVVTPIINVLSAIFRAYGAVVSYIWQWIVALARLAWNNIMNAIRPVINWLRSAMQGVGNFIASVWNRIKAAAAAVWNAIKAFIAPIINWLRSVMSSVGSFIGGVWNRIRNTASSAFSGVRSFIGGAANAVRNIWGGISGFFSGLFGRIGSAAAKVKGSISSAFTNAFDAIKGIATGAINFVIDKINGMINKVNSVAGKVPGAPKIPNIGRLANGTANWGGGVAMVGERGPEMVNLPKGAQVYSATRTANAMRAQGGAGGTTIQITGNIYNTTPEAVDRFYDRLNRIDQLTAMGVAT